MTEMKLSDSEQKKHDDVIEFVRADLIKEGLTVKTNKGTDKNNDVNDVDEEGKEIKIYPDVYTFKEKYVERIYEVETESSVVKSEVPQWKQYSKGNVDFYLVVPKDRLDDAKKLATENNITVKGFLTY